MPTDPRWPASRLTLALGLLGLLIAGLAYGFSACRHLTDLPPPPSRPRFAGTRRCRPRREFSVGLACVGMIGTIVSSSILFDVWHARWTWLQSEEYRQITRELEAISPPMADSVGDRPSLTAEAEPRMPDSAPRIGLPVDEAGRLATPEARGPQLGSVRARGRPVIEAAVASDPTQLRPSATSRPRTPDVVGAELRFLDSPQSGARLSLGVTLRNGSGAASAPVVIGIPAAWFEHVDIIGAIPPVLDDRADDDGHRYFHFPGVAPGEDIELALHIVSTGEEVRAPMVNLALQDGVTLGELRPTIVGPGPPSGPVRALRMPRLGIQTGVVATAWEPPPFVAGQISSSAALGEGNSVLVGHREGHAGDVFARLAGARIGDEVVAASRGVEHRYTVSETRILPARDSTPIGPTDTPRLTLMTCIGAWNPLTGDYSHRLWVIAEPPEHARATLSATIARANHTAATSTSPSEVARARTDAAVARAALSVMQAAERRARP